ncbi:uncharacterized protein [Macrobrachium rosenbergii]|uniref:uncharacterized protein isoform X2 n=1 Tax=Macrobrachium rosenbergii TaxID=79674 RepID=UPI0034D69241
MPSIFMRWIWRLYLRPGTTKAVVFVCMFLVAGIMFLQNQEKYQDASSLVLVPVDVEKPRALDVSASGDSKGDSLSGAWVNGAVLSIEEDPIREPFSDWLTVEHSKRELFVYASYLDQRKGLRYVRVIAIIKRKKKVSQCELTTGNQTITVPAKTKIIRENWNLLYSAAFVLCDVPQDISAPPESVALVHGGKVDKSSIVPVQSLTDRAYHGNMSVCIKPFHYEFNRAVWLVEFVEFYRLLGASHFIFYNHTVGPDVKRVLEHYQSEGVATVLPWALPVQSQSEIRTEGIFAALNDCNYRSIGRFNFTAHVDVDEFLVPRGYAKLLDLMSGLGNYNTYVFQNVFFYLYWENDTTVHDAMFGEGPSSNLGISLFGEESLAPYLLTVYKTRRLSRPHKPGTRSKFIVRPESVVEVGNHNVWEHISGAKKVLNVPPNKGLSHHYRICEFGGFDCLKGKNEIDRTTQQWMVPLMRRVAEQCRSIFPTLQRCPVAPPLGSPW